MTDLLSQFVRAAKQALISLVWRRFSLVCAVGICLAGCDAKQNNGERYLERLASALDLQIEVQQAPSVPAFPSPSSLRIERPVQKINLLEYLEVNRCELGALIGARNSGLGRVQTPSQRWLYDTQLVAGLLACENANAELQALAAQRQSELGIAAFNALFAGPEWHEFATPPVVAASVKANSDSLSDDKTVIDIGFDEANVERALLGLNSLVVASPTSDAGGKVMSLLETHLATLRFSSGLGRQRQAWAAQSAVLEQATRMLLSALATNPACRTGEPTVQGKIRLNIFQRFYVAGVQPELASQGQSDRGWVRAASELVTNTLAGVAGVKPLEESKENIPSEALMSQVEVVQRWHEGVFGEHPRSEYGRWKAAITAHSRAWQRQLGICGLMPGIEQIPSS